MRQLDVEVDSGAGAVGSPQQPLQPSPQPQPQLCAGVEEAGQAEAPIGKATVCQSTVAIRISGTRNIAAFIPLLYAVAVTLANQDLSVTVSLPGRMRQNSPIQASLSGIGGSGPALKEAELQIRGGLGRMRRYG